MGSEYDDFEDELVGSTTQQKNWRGILIALLVIVSVLGLIVTAIVLVTPKNVEENIGESLTYTDFIDGKFDPPTFRAVWGSDDVLYYRNLEGAVLQYKVSDNSTTTILLNSTFRELDTDIYTISADGKYALLTYDVQKVYRYSYKARYRILEIDTQLHIDLPGPRIKGEDMGNEFQYATWTPDDHNIVVVIQNNIYMLSSWSSLKSIDGSLYHVVTDDGETNTIYNGVPDWMYEEEILKSEKALWLNPDGSGIVYAKFDDRQVQKYDMTVYGQMKNKYIGNKKLPYPRPNTTNPTVTIHYFNFTSKETTTFILPSEFSDYYFLSLVWIGDTQVIVVWLNRQQNVSYTSICNTELGNCTVHYKIEAETGWLDMTQAPVIADDRQSYFIISSKNDNQFGSYKHIEKINMRSNEKAVGLFVTSGEMEVQKILAFNKVNHLIYYLAVNPNDPRERHLYSSPTNPDDKEFMSSICYTCDLSDDCLYVDVTFNNVGQNFVLSCLGPGVPYHQLMTSSFIPVKMLEEYSALRQTLSGKGLPVVEYKKLMTEDGHELWIKILLPPTLKKEEIIKHHLILHVNGAPGTQMVTHKFSMDWDQYMVSSHEFIVAYVDARGTGGRGDDWLFAIHKKLGKLEVTDMISAAKYFQSLPYVHEKMAIYGMSHGGYLTSSVLGNRDNIFKCAAVISPITDWRYYDSFYSEKYMGFPTEADNLRGYGLANVSENANTFRKSRFLLLHGTADENVHFQHSAQLIKSLTEKDVYFKTQIYTDQGHYLNGGNTKNHVYNTLEDFLYQCFDKIHPRDQPPVVIEEEEE